MASRELRMVFGALESGTLLALRHTTFNTLLTVEWRLQRPEVRPIGAAGHARGGASTNFAVRPRGRQRNPKVVTQPIHLHRSPHSVKVRR